MLGTVLREDDVAGATTRLICVVGTHAADLLAEEDDLARALATTWKRAADQIEQSLTDALMRGILQYFSRNPPLARNRSV